MFVFRPNGEHLQTGFFDTVEQLPERIGQRLEQSWAGTFYREIFCRIDESRFAKLYAEEPSRPNTPVNVVVGLDILKAGFDVVHQEAVYDYWSTSTFRDPESPVEPLPPVTVVDTHLDPEGTAFGLYLADRLRIVDPLVVELGLRWDRQTWIGEDQLSPRVNFMYIPDEPDNQSAR